MDRAEKAGIGLSLAGHAALLAVLSLGLIAPKPLPQKPKSDPIDIQFADEVGLVSGAPEPATAAPAASAAPELGEPEEAAAAEAEPAPPAPRPTPPPPAPEPEPAPKPRPAPPEPAPAPRPAPKPVPKPAPAPAPKPTPKPVPKPAPAPKPVPRPVPKPPVKPAPAKAAPAKPAPAKTPAAKPATTTERSPAKVAPAKSAPAKSAPAKSASTRPAPAKAAPARAAPGKAAATAGAGAGSGRRTAGAALGDDFLKGITAERSESRSQAPRAATVSAAQMAGLVGAIQRQLLPCADRRSSPGPGSNRIVTRMRLQFRKDGTLASAPTVLGQTGTDDENGRYATRVGELAIGIARECSPLTLPPELYEVGNGQGWNDIVIRYKLPG